MRRLASASAPDASQAALLVQPGLFTLGAEESAIAQLAQNSRSLHSRLEAFEKGFWVFALSKRYIGQISSPRVWISEVGRVADDSSCDHALRRPDSAGEVSAPTGEIIARLAAELLVFVSAGASLLSVAKASRPHC